jgi:DHA3 family macrolide efflux protein-like MFS transporter
LATLGLATLMLNGVTDLRIILLAVGVRSIGAGVQTPAVQAMIPQLVPADRLMRVNGIFQTVQSALALLAPAVAGVVFGVFGIVPVFFIDVATAAVGIALLGLVTVPTLAAVAERTTGFREDLAEGARYIWHHAFVRWLMVVFALIFLLTVAPSFVTPLMVASTWGPEVWMVTVLELAFSVGMLVGGVLVSTVLAKRSRIALIVGSTFLFAVLTVVLGLSPSLWFFYAVMLLIGLAVPLFYTSLITLLQETVPPDRHGRVFGYVSIVMALATPIGMAAFGPLADVISVRTLLVAAGVVTAVVMAVAVAVPSGRSAIRAAAAGQALVERPVEPAEPLNR